MQTGRAFGLAALTDNRRQSDISAYLFRMVESLGAEYFNREGLRNSISNSGNGFQIFNLFFFTLRKYLS